MNDIQTLSPVAALRRAVLLDPHDDTARLVLADAIDETGSEMEAKWAELIRCQIRLARPPWNSKDMLRAEALIRDLTPWLRRGERCERCKGKGMMRKRATRLGGEEHRCPTCHGIGWLGSLAEFKRESFTADGWRWTIPATIARGFVSRVELTAAQVQDAGFLRRLFGEWPIVEAVLVGAVPYWNGAGYAWFRSGRESPSLLVPLSAEVPDVLIDTMSDKPGRRLAWKPTAEAANAALSAAVVSLGRAAAGLPQMWSGRDERIS